MTMRKNKKKHQFKIRTKITLMYLFLSAILLGVLLPTMYLMTTNYLWSTITTNMQTSMSNVEKCVYLDLNDAPNVDDEYCMDYDSIATDVYIRIKDQNGNIVYESKDADYAFMWYEDNEKDWQYLKEDYDVYYDGEHIVSIEAIGNIYFNTLLDDMRWIWWIMVPCYLIIATIGSYMLAKAVLRPIKEITKTAKKIKDGDLHRRIETVNSNDEVGRLADSFNDMVEELDISFEREKQFTSDASHELRTPVSVISACVEEALSSDDPDIRQENLEMIQNEVNRMTKIIAQLLQLSRGYEGRYQFEPEEISIYDVIDSVADISSIEAEKRSITIHNEVDQKAMIYADQSLITQVMMNIIGNAVKYGNENGNVWIKSLQDDHYIWTIIEDDGIGISEEDLDHIFERFYRADEARDRNGSGLGLAIVKWIIDLHKGRIKVASTLGEGTKFMIGLPKKAKESKE